MKTKIIKWVSLAAVLLSSSVAQSERIPGRYVAVFKTNMIDVEKGARALAGQHGLEVGYIYTRAIKGFAFAGSEQAAAALTRQGDVAYVELDQVYTACAQTVPTGIRRCGAEGLRGVLAANPGWVDVDVAVVDSGLDKSHPDLNIVPGGVRFAVSGGKNRLISDSNWLDDNGHGTHIGGIIGALDNDFGLIGVAPGVRLWAVKVLDSGGRGTVSTILAGIDWVVQHADTIEVANMSLSGSFSQAVNDAVKAATSAGVVCVVPAGNSSGDTANNSPASEPTALTVSALDDNDGLAGGFGGITKYGDYDDALAEFSDSGALVDVCAPGVGIYSTYLMTNGGYRTMSGTSTAAAHVAGAAALYIATHGLTKTAEGVEAVCQAIRASGWQAGHYAYFLDLDAYPEPLLNVAKLVYWPPSSMLHFSIPSDATKVSGQTTIQVSSDLPATSLVQFYLDGRFLGQDSEAVDGWGITWDTTQVADGVHTLVAVAADGTVQVAGDALLVGVNNANGLGPSAWVLEPTFLSANVEFPVFVTGTTNLLAAAADMGSVAGVDFYYAGNHIGTGVASADGWSLAWDTTGVPDGTNKMFAVATGADGTQGRSAELSVAVMNHSMHVGELEGSSAVESNGKWSATVQITVHDLTHNPIPGATVFGTWKSRPPGLAVPSSAVTDANGVCFFKYFLANKYYGVNFYVDGISAPDPSLHYDYRYNDYPVRIEGLTYAYIGISKP